MARIAGIDLQDNKRVKFALTRIYGVGMNVSKLILSEAKIDGEKTMSALTDQESNRLNTIIEAKYKVEGELRQKVYQDIKRLKDIRSFRGLRHKNNLPANGQNTRTNSRTRKGKSIAVGGLTRKIDKK